MNQARLPERADAAEGHLGHALGWEARDEAVAQVARAVDVDVAHRVVVGPSKDREEAAADLLQQATHHGFGDSIVLPW